MKKINQSTCYFCEKVASTREHVPARCIFPEGKDLPPGVDLRRTLLKVPSCKEHNSETSRDDEYFLYILGISNQINMIGRDQFNTKIKRAIIRNPRLHQKIFHEATQVQLVDPHSLEEVQSLACILDEERVNGIIGKISRAIFFHHYKTKWKGEVKYQADFLQATINPLDVPNLRMKAIAAEAEALFKDVPFYGSNPTVFKYQVIKEMYAVKFRLHFYEGCKILLIFIS